MHTINCSYVIYDNLRNRHYIQVCLTWQQGSY